MALTYVASMPLSALVPSVYLSIGQVAVALSASLQGNLSLSASLTATPPTLAIAITDTIEFEAQLGLAIAAVPPVPTVSFDASACAALTAELEASLGLLVVLDGLLAAAIGIYSFGYSGTGTGLGPAVTSELASTWPDGSPTSTSTTAFVFGAVSSISQQQMALFLDGLRFTSGLTYSGKIGLDVLSGITLRAATQGEAGINAQLAATAALQASLAVSVPNLLATLESIGLYLANLRAQVTVPDVSFALAATAQAIASLQANFGLLCELGAALSRFDATLFVYSYSGLGNALGLALTTALASTWGDGTTPTSGACTAAVLGATDSLTAATMAAFFGGA